MSRLLVFACLLCPLGAASNALAQSTDESSAAEPAASERMRRALDREPRIRIEEATRAQPTFRTEVEERLPARTPRFEPRDVSPGVQPSVPAWHSEFLRMVTPETARPYAAFNQKELATVTATTMANAGIAYAAKAGIKLAAEAVRKRRVERIRRQIAAEVAAIEARSRVISP
jgi:hypothetical protein